MISEDFSLRKYREEDFREYAEVFRSVYGKELDSNFLAWKHQYNPARGQDNLIYLILNCKNKIIGSLSFFPYLLKYQSIIFRAVQSGDFMIISDYRGKGLFKKIQDFATLDLQKNGYALIFGFANTNSYRAVLRCGYSDLGLIRLCYRIFNWEQFLGNLGPLFYPIGKLMNLGPQLIRIANKLSPKSIYQVTPVEVTHPIIVNFISKIQYCKISPLKDLNYLTWKYQQKPGVHYETLVVMKHNEPVAVLVIRPDRTAQKLTGEILEFITMENQPSQALRKIVFRFLRDNQYDFIKFWEPNSARLREKLFLFSIIKRKVDLHFVVNFLNKDLEIMNHREIWEVIGGHADTA